MYVSKGSPPLSIIYLLLTITLRNQGKILAILSKLLSKSFCELSFEKCLTTKFCFFDCFKRVSKCFDMAISPLVKAAKSLWRILNWDFLACWIRNLRWFAVLHLTIDFKNGLLFFKLSSNDKMCSLDDVPDIPADHWSVFNCWPVLYMADFFFTSSVNMNKSYGWNFFHSFFFINNPEVNDFRSNCQR